MALHASSHALQRLRAGRHSTGSRVAPFYRRHARAAGPGTTPRALAGDGASGAAADLGSIAAAAGLAPQQLAALFDLADAADADAKSGSSGGFLAPLTDSLEFILKSLQSGLDAVHVPYSYGFSIIALTVLVKLATLPLTKKQVGAAAATPQPSLARPTQRGVRGACGAPRSVARGGGPPAPAAPRPRPPPHDAPRPRQIPRPSRRAVRPWCPQVESAMAVQSMKPRVDMIKARYGEDEKRVQKETNALYEQAGVDPLAGERRRPWVAAPAASRAVAAVTGGREGCGVGGGAAARGAGGRARRRPRHSRGGRAAHPLPRTHPGLAPRCCATQAACRRWRPFPSSSACTARSGTSQRRGCWTPRCAPAARPARAPSTGARSGCAGQPLHLP